MIYPRAMADSLRTQLTRAASGLARRLTRDLIHSRAAKSSAKPKPPRRRRRQGPGQDRPTDYPGDFVGVPDFAYNPELDGEADPGEIVWTWVPYEEDHRQGKDRPVLLIGHDGPWLLALQLTSKDHDRDADTRTGRHWVDIGSGDWDAERRPSEVRVNRIIRVDPNAVRREGAILDRERFEQVSRAVLEHL